MRRRSFLRMLGCLPFLGFLKKEEGLTVAKLREIRKVLVEEEKKRNRVGWYSYEGSPLYWVWFTDNGQIHTEIIPESKLYKNTTWWSWPAGG